MQSRNALDLLEAIAALLALILVQRQETSPLCQESLQKILPRVPLAAHLAHSLIATMYVLDFGGA